MITTRRALLGAGGAALAACATTPPSGGRARDVVVVGAGVLGAWTAEHLRRAGKRVLLVDKAGPAHARASSGGESRLTRTIYGKDAIYTRTAAASLPEWKAISAKASLPIFHETGVVIAFDAMSGFARDSIDAHRELGLPLVQMDAAELSRRWPQMSFDGVEVGLYEPAFGALMARRGVQEVVRGFVEQGGELRVAHAVPSSTDGHAVLLNGEETRADAVVYACGPWLGKVFPELLGGRIFVTRQEAAFIAPPDGDGRFDAGALPSWAYLLGDQVYYGFPSLESRGFKLAHDNHGPIFDPDTGDRRMTDAGAEDLRAFAAARFPALAGRPFTEFRVCQYENSSNGDLLVDRHPDLEGVFLVGAGSGHAFKDAPEIGRIAADLVLGRGAPDPRFGLATKGTAQRRDVI